MEKAQKIYCIILFLAIAFTIGTLAMFGTLTTHRLTWKDDKGNSGSSNQDVICDNKDYGPLKTTVDYNNGDSATLTCPWSGGLLVLAYISLIISLLFLTRLVFRNYRFFNTLKALRAGLLVGLISTGLLLLTFIVMVAQIPGKKSAKDYSTSSYDVNYSKVPYRGNAVLVFFTFAFVGALFFYEVWTYRRNAKGAGNGAPASNPPPRTMEKANKV